MDYDEDEYYPDVRDLPMSVYTCVYVCAYRYWYITGVMIGHSAGDVLARSRRDAVCLRAALSWWGQFLIGAGCADTTLR